MSHELEIVNGKVAMAWAGETPWHGLGKEIPYDLTPEQILEAASLDWEVNKIPVTYDLNGIQNPTGRSALIRSSDSKMLDIVTDDWEPVQNAEAFGFFHEWVMAGDMNMHTAGSLHGGRMVWALAKVNDDFTLENGDHVEGYPLFSNPHQYGRSIDVRFPLS